jgi:uncharacterized membrane protein
VGGFNPLAFWGKGARMNNSPVWIASGAVLAAGLALVAGLAERARARRGQLDRVGFMPWTAVSFWSTMMALILAGALAHRLL